MEKAYRYITLNSGIVKQYGTNAREFTINLDVDNGSRLLIPSSEYNELSNKHAKSLRSTSVVLTQSGKSSSIKDLAKAQWLMFHPKTLKIFQKTEQGNTMPICTEMLRRLNERSVC